MLLFFILIFLLMMILQCSMYSKHSVWWSGWFHLQEKTFFSVILCSRLPMFNALVYVLQMTRVATMMSKMWRVKIKRKLSRNCVKRLHPTWHIAFTLLFSSLLAGNFLHVYDVVCVGVDHVHEASTSVLDSTVGLFQRKPKPFRLVAQISQLYLTGAVEK